MIGVAISTRNRPDVFRHVYDRWKAYLPSGAILVVVDDASDTNYANADYRFEENVGIAQVKNKGIELLSSAGVTDFFLVDDDVMPTEKEWYNPYVESGINHLCMTPHVSRHGNRMTYLNGRPVDGYMRFDIPWGCMLYFKKICFDTVGGMDPAYGLWGYEHLQLSKRIFNAGLTPYPFMDVIDGYKLFYSYDFYGAVERVTPYETRIECLKRNQPMYEALGGQAIYCPFI